MKAYTNIIHKSEMEESLIEKVLSNKQNLQFNKQLRIRKW
jgi:hypothetical protein